MAQLLGDQLGESGQRPGVEEPGDDSPPSTGSGDKAEADAPPCSTLETIAEEYERMSNKVKIQQTEFQILIDKSTCRINCLRNADKELTLASHQFKKIAQDYLFQTPNSGPQENEEDGLQCSSGTSGAQDESTVTFNAAIKHYNGALLENIVQQHFQKKLAQLSTIFRDTLKQVTDKIMSLEAELQQTKQLTNQLIGILMASQSSQQSMPTSVSNDPSDFLPHPSPVYPDLDGDDHDLPLPPSPPKSTTSSHASSSGIEDIDDDDQVLSELEEPASLPSLFNLSFIDQDAPTLTPTITVPACLITLSPSSSSSPPALKIHAWKILNRPMKTNWFHCICTFKCITFSGLLNHFRKLKIFSTSQNHQESPPSCPPSPPLIIVEDEPVEFIRLYPTPTPPPPSIPSTVSASPLPSTCNSNTSVSSSVIEISSPEKGSGDGKKKRNSGDPSRVLYKCSAVSLLANGKHCVKKFASVGNMKRHKKIYHPLEEDFDEWGCGDCGRIFSDESLMKRHELNEHNMERKRVEDEETWECSLCEAVGVKSDKCAIMHKQIRKKKKLKGLVVEGKNGRRMRKRCKVDTRKLEDGIESDVEVESERSRKDGEVYISFDGD